MSGDFRYEIMEEQFDLMPERALFWERRETLLVADTHWGKEGGFLRVGRKSGHENITEDLSRLSRALNRKMAKRLLVLGDLINSRTGRDPVLMNKLEKWRNCHPDLEITVVRGENDQDSFKSLESWDFLFVDGPILIPPFFIRHNATRGETAYTIAGHLHPAVELVNEDGQRVRRHCFWFGKRIGVLPAFGSNPNSRLFKPDREDDVFIVEEEKVLRLD
jgi:DNA ligase-associated metallophosphoesterase